MSTKRIVLEFARLYIISFVSYSWINNDFELTFHVLTYHILHCDGCLCLSIHCLLLLLWLDYFWLLSLFLRWALIYVICFENYLCYNLATSRWIWVCKYCSILCRVYAVRIELIVCILVLYLRSEDLSTNLICLFIFRIRGWRCICIFIGLDALKICIVENIVLIYADFFRVGIIGCIGNMASIAKLDFVWVHCNFHQFRV